MHPIDADQLPVGFVRVGAAGLIVETNHAFRAWADCNAPEGRALTEFLVPIDDFLEAESRPGMMARPDRADRTAFLIASDDGASFAVVDASERYAAGRALREGRRLADRTQKRLQLVIDSSIAFAEATTEEGLAEILATTAAEAYRAEDATVYLADESETLIRISGTNPFEEWSSADSTQLANFGLREVLKVSGWVEAAALSPRLGEVMQATGVHSVIAAPLHLDGEVLGVFVCFFHHPRQFDEEAAPLAEALAGQASQALANLRLQRRLEHAASHDQTTGLPNRRRLELEGEGGAGAEMAVLFIDLDGFKAVNDFLGHQRGDDILREVALRLRSVIREEDVVLRYGGDEFVVVCTVSEDHTIGRLGDRIREALRAPYKGLPAELSISASVGIATGSEPIDTLIRAADQAMYEAKVKGGNQVVAA